METGISKHSGQPDLCISTSSGIQRSDNLHAVDEMPGNPVIQGQWTQVIAIMKRRIDNKHVETELGTVIFLP